MPQDLDYPSLRVDVDRLHAAKLGLTETPWGYDPMFTPDATALAAIEHACHSCVRHKKLCQVINHGRASSNESAFVGQAEKCPDR